MSKTKRIQVNVPEDIEGLLSRAAAAKGSTVSGTAREFLIVHRDTLRQWAGDGEAAA